MKTHWCPVSPSSPLEGPKVPFTQSSSASDKLTSFLSQENLPDSFLKSVPPVHQDEVLYFLQIVWWWSIKATIMAVNLLWGKLEEFKELTKSKGVGKITSSFLTLFHCLPPGQISFVSDIKVKISAPSGALLISFQFSLSHHITTVASYSYQFNSRN